MTGQKGRSGGARPGAGRPLTDVYRVIIEQVADKQAVLSRRNDTIYVQFPDEQEPIPLKELAYSQEIGLYDKRRFPDLEEKPTVNNYRNYNAPLTIDLTTKEDGTIRTYRVRELVRGGRATTVEAVSKDEAKTKARNEPPYLDGKLSVDIVNK